MSHGHSEVGYHNSNALCAQGFVSGCPLNQKFAKGDLRPKASLDFGPIVLSKPASHFTNGNPTRGLVLGH